MCRVEGCIGKWPGGWYKWYETLGAENVEASKFIRQELRLGELTLRGQRGAGEAAEALQEAQVGSLVVGTGSGQRQQRQEKGGFFFYLF